MTTSNGVFHTLARKDAVGGLQPPRHSQVQRLAENLSRKNVDAAIVELMNEAHSRLIQLCYETSEGTPCNLDVTGRILVPLPWGKKGHAKWGITSTESILMRAIMFTRMRKGVPLFFFDRSRRSWYIDMASYPVMPVVSEWEISVGEYRLARGR